MRTIITSENFAAVWMVVIFVYRFQMLEAREKDWYRTASMYQVYTRSFKDTNGDGVGDIKGVHEKLDYIQKVGFDTIWIQTLFKSPMKDMGYDISDFMAVDPLFGTMEELKKLIDDIHTRGMKVIVDFVPNHTSDESEWFEKSINKIEPYTDFYVWANPNGSDPETQLPLPPNNWLSVFGDSMWEWNEKRQQFYLHQFSISQPDLNYRNPKVKDAMKNVLRFWLDFGVDGFRVDAIAHLVEDALLRDNPWRSPEKTGKRDFYDQIPKYSSLQEETYQVTHEWRSMLDEYEDKGLGVRIMTFEMYDDLDVTRKFFGNETYKIMHFPLNVRTFLPMHMKNATDTSDTIRDYIELMPSVGVPSWIMSNHDISRMATRSFPEFSVPGFMIALLLPGVVSIYYGEEICMQQMLLRKDQLRDASKKIEKLNPGHSLRDPCRTPMQWDDSPNAGFTKESVMPWLPVNPNYFRVNVARQLQDPQSHLKTFMRLMELRKSAVIMDGQLEMCAPTPWLLVFQRSLRNQASAMIVVVVNMGTEIEAVSLGNCSMKVPREMEVHTASENSGFKIGDKFTIGKSSSLQPDRPKLRPKSGVVLTLFTSSSNGCLTSVPCLLVLIISAITSMTYQHPFLAH